MPAHRVGGGAELVAATATQGLEGVIAKRLDSRYRPGTRSKEWRKIKNRTVVELTIGGFTAGDGQSGDDVRRTARRATNAERPAVRRRRRHGLRPAHARVVDRASCAHTSSTPARSILRHRLPVRRGATWLDPVLRASLEIAEFTNDGLVRHASFLNLVP